LRDSGVCATASSEVRKEERRRKQEEDATFRLALIRLLCCFAAAAALAALPQEDPVHLDLSSSLRPNVGRECVYSVAFDPLDGSSIIDANFSVGSDKPTNKQHAH
jgi:fructose-1,6-bisphosphatase